MPPPAHTCLAASRLKPPANTDKRRSNVRSCSESRLSLHLIIAWRVGWRADTERELPESRPRSSSSVVAMSATASTLTSAAANSMANGIRRLAGRSTIAPEFAVAEREVGTSQQCPVGEQTHGRALADRRRSRRRLRQLEEVPVGRFAQRRGRGLHGSSPGSAAAGSGAENLGQLATGVDDVLAVVEHNDRGPILKVMGEAVAPRSRTCGRRRRVGAGAALEQIPRSDAAALATTSSLGAPDRSASHTPVRERHEHLGGDLQRQPRLAGPTGPRDRAQPVGVEQVDQLGDLVLGVR